MRMLCNIHCSIIGHHCSMARFFFCLILMLCDTDICGIIAMTGIGGLIVIYDTAGDIMKIPSVCWENKQCTWPFGGGGALHGKSLC